MDRLHVEIVQARNLLPADNNGLSDPFANVVLVDRGKQKIARAGKHVTKTVKATLNPVFKEKFTFGEKYDIRNAHALRFRVYDYDFLGKNELLGIAYLPLSSIKGQMDKWLPLEKDDNMKKVQGELRVKIHKDGDPGTKSKAPSVASTKVPPPADKEGQEKSSSTNITKITDLDERQKNLLLITVHRASNLRAMDNNGTSDPYVKIHCNGRTERTEVIKKTLTPVWEQQFRIPVRSNSESITFTVKDRDTLVSDFIGMTTLPLVSLANGLKVEQKEYELVGKKGQQESTTRGTLVLSLHWTHDEEEEKKHEYEKEKKPKQNIVSAALSNTIAIVTNKPKEEEEYDSEEEQRKQEQMTKSPEVLEEERKEKEKLEREMEKELADIEIKSGDYTMNIHIIEARDLKPKDASGTSDPVVVVQVLNEKQHTETKFKTLTCVWDDMLIFNFRNLDKEEIEMGQIKISVMDANTVCRNELIGYAQFDTSYVYSQKDHEIYRTWVGLSNPDLEETKSSTKGVEGYLKCSLTILGPSDKMKVHNLEKELELEAESELKGSGLGTNVLMPPSIQQDVYFLVASIYYAEALPPLDSNKLGRDGLDAFVEVAAGGVGPIKTSIKSVKGKRAQLNPEFNTEIWLPITVPSMSKSIVVAVKDWDRFSKDDVVGHSYHNLKLVEKCKTMSPFWMNFYGAPLAKAKISMLKDPTSVLKDPNNLLSDPIHQQMNTFPEYGSTYRGRLLASFRIEENKHGLIEEIPHCKRIKSLPSNLIPSTKQYQIRALIVSGTEIPKIPSLSHARTAKMQVIISCGMSEVCTPRELNEKGIVNWNQYLESSPIDFPADVSQIPDIFIYLSHGKEESRKPTSFRRFSVKEFLNPEYPHPLQLGAQWVVLKEDNALNELLDTEFPGTILMRLDFVCLDEKQPRSFDSRTWQHELSRLGSRFPYEVRVNIFQARGLPAADSNGLLDPYIKVRLGQDQEKTTVKHRTTDPCWYETLVFNTQLPEIKYAPEIVLRVYDDDVLGDDYVGSAFINLNDAFTLKDLHNMDQRLPDPKWYPMIYQEAGDNDGEIFVSVQLIKKTSPDDVFPPCIPITPKMRTAYLELTVLGLRDLEPFEFQPIQLPYVDFCLGSKENLKQAMHTEKSKRPSGTNPNFLQRIVREVELPENAIFAPRLNVQVKDTRLGGFRKPVVATCSIDITSKLPWAESYTPPRIASTLLPDEKISTTDLLGGGTQTMSTGEEVVADDLGAGVFGGIEHSGEHEQADCSVIDIADTPAEDEEEELDSLKYMKDRQVLDSDLETEFGNVTPFESYPLFSGKKKAGAKSKKGKQMFTGTYRQVGVFKGIVRVMLNKDDPPLVDLQQLLTPLPYEVRVYVLNGESFMPMDVGIGGRPGKSDPYLKIQLGKDRQNNKKDYIKDTTSPEFNRMFSFETKLPGTSQLQISTFDYDVIGKDDLIGQTTIDLEDRLFDPRWMNLGVEHETLGEATCKEDEEDVSLIKGRRYRPRPVEARSLTIPSSTANMGTLRLWVDVMTPLEASMFPPVDISPIPCQEFELRVIIWKTKNVVSFDEWTDQNDLYAVGWIDDDSSAKRKKTNSKQKTDVHWRCKKGKGSFNWRMKYDITLGPKSFHMKYPYFHLQLWDKDLVTSNDAIGERIFHLGNEFRKAYRTKKGLVFFPSAPKPRDRPNRAPTPEEKKAIENNNAVESVKEMTGLWDLEPKDSKWVSVENREKKKMGEVCISMELIPKALADAMPCGFGRSEPNVSPYLPPPTGRFVFSLNPYYVFRELFGPSICRKIMCCGCCLVFVVLVYFCAPFLNLAISLL